MAKVNPFERTTDISEFISKFENSCVNDLRAEKINNWLAWHILRKPLYFVIKSKVFPKHQKNNAKSTKSIFNFAIFSISFLINFFVYRNKILAITRPRYVEQSGQNLFYKFFLEENPNSVIKEVILSERKATVGFGGVNWQDGISFLQNVFKVIFRFDTKIVEISERFYFMLNEFAKARDIDLPVTTKDIRSIFLQFLGQQLFYRIVFKCLQPKKILVIDSVGSGLTAAGLREGLEVYEFQHGFFDLKKPDYHIPEVFLSLKHLMVCPTKIFTFGDAFTTPLIASGFWTKSEIITLGNPALHNAPKSGVTRTGNGSRQLMIITQPSLKNELRAIITLIKNWELGEDLIHIKLHPNEDKSSIEWYKNLLSSSNNFVIHEGTENIVKAMQTCDIVCGFHSTALIEAMAIRKEVWLLETSETSQNTLIKDYIGDKKFSKLVIIESGTQLHDAYLNRNQEAEGLGLLDAGDYFFAADYDKRAKEINDLFISCSHT